MLGGVKHDDGKPRYDLVPPDALDEIVKALTFGAREYEDRNWEKGMNWGRYFGACMRHLWAYWCGEETDPDSGLSHLAHAGCCVFFLLAYELRGIGVDDRRA